MTGQCREFSATGEELDAAVAIVKKAMFRLVFGRVSDEEREAFNLTNQAKILGGQGHRLDECPKCEAA